MGETTKISWANKTWNGWRGCHAVSPACAGCYAKAAFKRTGWDFNQVTRTKTWGDPDKWQKKLNGTDKCEMVFTCSWSDFWLPEADQWRGEAWDVIRRCPNLIWQILTKRPGLMPKRLPPDWGQGWPNVWLGVSVENKDWLWRITELKKVPAAVHFLSLEPLLEDVCPKLDAFLDDIEWVIVGGESGNGPPNFRPMDLEWARRIRDLCKRRGVPYFFKQSAARRTEMGTKLDGQTLREYPPLPTGGSLPGRLVEEKG